MKSKHKLEEVTYGRWVELSWKAAIGDRPAGHRALEIPHSDQRHGGARGKARGERAK